MKKAMSLPSTSEIDTSFPWASSSCLSVIEWHLSIQCAHTSSNFSGFMHLNIIFPTITSSYEAAKAPPSMDWLCECLELELKTSTRDSSSPRWLGLALIALRKEAGEVGFRGIYWASGFCLQAATSLEALDGSSSFVLQLCLRLLPDWVKSGEGIEPSCNRVAVNHVERSLETLSCFSASERSLKACFNLSNSASVTEAWNPAQILKS